MPKTFPDFSFEKELWIKGHKFVGGIDEVGRGAFAGPVVAACVVFRSSFVIQENAAEIVNDSKKLSPKQRELANIWIKRNSLKWGIGKAGVAEINKYGIKKATEIAMRKAIANCKIKLDYILIDAFYVPHTKGLRRKKQKPIVKGDTLSISIAAASIIAKVHRDRLMIALSKNIKYQKYKWNENKGYGTKSHREAIEKHGPVIYHRKDFIRNVKS